MNLNGVWASMNFPSLITGAGRKPRSTVRSPIAPLRENVPPGALAVSAGKQRNIEGWVARKRGSA